MSAYRKSDFEKSIQTKAADSDEEAAWKITEVKNVIIKHYML